MLSRYSFGIILLIIGTFSLVSAEKEKTIGMSTTLDKLKNDFVDEAKKQLDNLKKFKLGERKRSNTELEESPEFDGNSQSLSSILPENPLSTGISLFKGLLDTFKSQFIDRFFDIVKNPMSSAMQNTESLQSILRAKKDMKIDDMDKIKMNFDLDLEKGLKKLNLKDMDKYLNLAKDFTSNLKSVVKDLAKDLPYLVNALPKALPELVKSLPKLVKSSAQMIKKGDQK